MGMYVTGSMIKEYRTRLKISQEELSFGLCAVSTLSRIESGMQVPGRKLLEALFSRMGMAPTANDIPMTKADIARSNIEYQIQDCVAIGNYEIADLLESYKSNGGELDILERQFYLYYRTLYERWHQGDFKVVLQRFEEALRLSIKDYALGAIPNAHLLTKTELMLLNSSTAERHKSSLPAQTC